MAEVIRVGPSVFGDRVWFAYRLDGTDLGRFDGREPGPWRFFCHPDADLTAPELRAIAAELERLEEHDG